MDSRQRLRAIFAGDPQPHRLVVSPSHEAVLTNVPPANLAAMAEAASAPAS